MSIFDALLKKKGDDKKSDRNTKILKTDHKSLIASKAKDLIEELVDPLSKPNQKLIDEVLTIITQTSQLPDSMVNKEEVQKITKKLLFELVEPISNPNKQLIDELVQLITISGSKDYKETVDGYVSEKKEEKLDEKKQIDNDDQNQSNLEDKDLKVSSEKERIYKGHAGLKQRQMQASAQAPFPTQIEEVKKKERESKSVMNLLLEQIKELITITNGLNSKIKSHQVRIDSFDSSIQEIKKKSQDFDERMLAFEKNMEKFIGLYEVVTNQYNPFVETSADFSDDRKESSNISDDIRKEESQKIELEVEEKPKYIEVLDKKINNIDDLSDLLISISEEEFEKEILNDKEKIFIWLEEVIENNKLKEDLSELNSRNEWIKSIIKNH
ncbi:MAG: flagella accessory protein C [Candidatus Woesearchaeota archaeon]